MVWKGKQRLSYTTPKTDFVKKKGKSPAPKSPYPDLTE